MPLAGVTRIRTSDEEARELLQDFIFGGMFGPGRVPRGIEPAFVAGFIEQELKPDSGENAYAKAVDALRFYERDEVVPHLLRALSGKELDEPSIRRSAHAIQAAGDLGPRALADRGADHLDRVLVPLPEARHVFSLLLETRVALAPSGSMDALAERIQREVDAAALTERQDEAHMMAYDKVAAIQRNDLSRALRLIDKKLAIQALLEQDQLEELVAVYMGRSAATGVLMETWAGRRLRFMAFTGRLLEVSEAFAREIAAASAAPTDQGYADFLIVRAAQAIIYLGGALPEPMRELYAATTGGAASFLWDDP